MTWLLLIYSVPAKPSRKRATIWREIKRAGAIYLRDGVCALPERGNTLPVLRRIADRVKEFGGEATLATSVHLDPAKEAWIVSRAQDMRAAEYSDIRAETNGLLAHIRQEREHRDFSFAELVVLEEDLAKLRRWFEQIANRDFGESSEQEDIARLLNDCEAELPGFSKAAYRQEKLP